MTDVILPIITGGGYLGIFLLMALENIIPPVPSEVIMGLAGMGVARGEFALVPLVLVGTAGTTVGNWFWYALGRRVGYERFRPLIERHGRWLTLDWHSVEGIHRFFLRHGGWIIFAFRFSPVMRTIISLPAGMTRMPLARFLVWTFLGSTIWNAILALAGLWLGSRFGELHRYVGPVAVATMAVIFLGYLYRVATWRPRG